MKTSQIFGNDKYQSLEKDVSLNDLVETFGSELEDSSFYERNIASYRITSFFTKYFPLISGLSLLMCVFFIGTAGKLYEFFHGELKLAEYALISVGMIGSVFLIMMNEIKKTSSLRSYFKAIAQNRKPLQTVRNTTVLTCGISIIGSAVGMFGITYSLSDKSHSIKSKATTELQRIAATFSNDSLRIVRQFEPIIDQKRETISKFDASRYRTKRDNLNNQILSLVGQMNDELDKMKTDYESKRVLAITTQASSLEENSSSSKQAGIIAFVVLVIMEIGNVISHRFNWQFKTKVVIEEAALKGYPMAPNNDSSNGSFVNGSGQVQGLGNIAPTNGDRNNAHRMIGYKSFQNQSAAPKSKGSPGKTAKGYQITCLNCQTVTVMKSHRAKYCSKKCREEYWEKTKGKTLPHKYRK